MYSILSRIAPYVMRAEKVFLAGLTLGLVLLYMSRGNMAIIQGCLLGLGIVYFQNAFQRAQPPETSGKMSFETMLATVIVPKVIWLSCGFTVFGLFGFALQMGHQGYLRMLLTGVGTLAPAILFTLYTLVSGKVESSFLLPFLFRAIPVLATGGYVMTLD